MDEAFDNPETIPVIDFPETAAGDDKGVIQWNESALASNTVAESGSVGIPDELRPITMDDTRPSLDERVFDVVKESGVAVEIREGDGFQLEPFAGKIRVDKLGDRTLCQAGPVDGREIRDDPTGRFVGRLIDEGL